MSSGTPLQSTVTSRSETTYLCTYPFVSSLRAYTPTSIYDVPWVGGCHLHFTLFHPRLLGEALPESTDDVHPSLTDYEAQRLTIWSTFHHFLVSQEGGLDSLTEERNDHGYHTHKSKKDGMFTYTIFSDVKEQREGRVCSRCGHRWEVPQLQRGTGDRYRCHDSMRNLWMKIYFWNYV